MKKKRVNGESGTLTGRVVCPECGQAVRVIPFGEGWVGTCCSKVVYNDRNPPGGRPPDLIGGIRES